MQTFQTERFINNISCFSIVGDKRVKERLSQIRGQILSDAVVIESALTWHLRTYFFPKANQKASDFHYYVLQTVHFSFDKKISLYEEIHYFKRLKSYAKTREALKFIKRLRNAVAHWEIDEVRSTENNIVLYTPVSFQRIAINAVLIEKFKEHEKILLKAFGWGQTLKEKYGTTESGTVWKKLA